MHRYRLVKMKPDNPRTRIFSIVRCLWTTRESCIRKNEEDVETNSESSLHHDHDHGEVWVLRKQSTIRRFALWIEAGISVVLLAGMALIWFLTADTALLTSW